MRARCRTRRGHLELQGLLVFQQIIPFTPQDLKQPLDPLYLSAMLLHFRYRFAFATSTAHNTPPRTVAHKGRTVCPSPAWTHSSPPVANLGSLWGSEPLGDCLRWISPRNRPAACRFRLLKLHTVHAWLVRTVHDLVRISFPST